MYTVQDEVMTTGSWSRPRWNKPAFPSFAAAAYQRLSKAFTQAHEIPFDDNTRIIFFSDLHRGDKSAADDFAPNEALFLHALNHYYDHNYTYIEVGDGDDLWSTQHFLDIRRAYAQVYHLLHRFHSQKRLHMLFGNHEISQEGHIQQDKDGLPVHESLVLRHSRTDQRLFVTHGHQVDLWCDPLAGFSRKLIRFLQLFNMQSETKAKGQSGTLGKIITNWSSTQQKHLEQRLTHWADKQQQILITGHTHRPVGNVESNIPYFNTGSGVHPHTITGLELNHGLIQLIKWVQIGSEYKREIVSNISLRRWA